MTMQEVKDRIDELIQSYPFINNSEVLIKTSVNADETETSAIESIEVDKYCRPIILIY